MAPKAGVAPSPTTRRGRRPPSPPPPPKPWWKRWWDRPRTRRRVLVTSGLGLLALLVLLTVRLFVVPDASLPARTDAVVTLAAEDTAVQKALELMNQQLAPVLVLSGGDDPAHTLAHRLCTQAQPFEVLCPAPDPADPAAGSPRGDARVVARLATERSWAQVALVSPPEQLSRARLLVERCTTARVAGVVVDNEVSERLGNLRQEGPGYLRSLFLDRGC